MPPLYELAPGHVAACHFPVTDDERTPSGRMAAQAAAAHVPAAVAEMPGLLATPPETPVADPGI